MAPFVFGYADNTNALWTSIILGVVIVLAAGAELLDQGKGKWEYWLAGLAGALAIVAPFVLGFSALATALWTSVIIGAVVLIISGYEVLLVEPTA